MRKETNVFERFTSFDNFYKAYLLVRRNKRYRQEILEYSAHLEENIINSIEHLKHKTYEVSRMREFYVHYPKKRLVMALPFKDRVVNCAAYNVLFPIYRRSFYEHSYGSIPNKGTHKAIDRLQYWLRIVSNKTELWCIAKLDIRKFFFRLPVDVQLRELGRPLDDVDMMWFLEQAIIGDGRPLGLPLEANDVEKAERVSGIGMQVGSLISQMTANVVLTPLDHYIKRVIKAPYYIRYMDDMIMLFPSKTQAWEAIGLTNDYLNINLRLELNDKTAVLPLDYGVEFLGRRVWRNKITLRKSTSLRMKRHLKHLMKTYAEGKIDQDKCLNVLHSYLGMLKHCDCDALRRKALEDFVLVRKN